MVRSRIKKGFTLAEVLITLAIIGVVAAMVIPALLGTTNQAEFKTALKKSIATLNQALSMSVALDANDAQFMNFTADANGAGQLANLFRGKLNVIANGPDGNSFYTADGMMFRFYINSQGSCGNEGLTTGALTATTNCVVFVDVNGSKNPNQASSTSGGTDTFRDQYFAVVKARSVVPEGTVAANAMFK